MSVDTTLDMAFTTLLGKAGGGSGSTTTQTSPVIVPTTNSGLTTITIPFSAGGLTLPSSGLPGVVEIPGSLSLVWVHMFAGNESGAPVAVTASVDVRLTSEGSFGGSTPIYGTRLPRLQFDAVASIDITDWKRNYTTGDAIVYRLASFSGLATWLTLTMQMRPTVVILGQTGIVDNSADTVVDNDGNPVVVRS